MKFCLQSETDGFIINPWGQAFILPKDLIEMIFEADGDADYENIKKAVKAAEAGEGLDSLVGQTFTNKDEVRLVPDILQNGDDFYFPVFTTAEEMGEYGTNFSKIEKHFLEAVNLAENNEKHVAGIVINAFSEPFVIPKEMFEVIAGMPSSL